MTPRRRAHFLLCSISLMCFCYFGLSCDAPQAPADDDGENEEGDGDDFHISIDGSLKLSVISGFEVYQLCKDIADGLNDVIDKELQCLRLAIAAGQIDQNYDEGACNESFLSCSTEDMNDYQSCDKYKETSEKYEDCDARVSEMDKCMGKTISALEDEYSGLTCASEDMRDPHEVEPCSACKDLEEKCPGITTNFDRLF
jgi:hypothetical protein